eukprot:116170-Amphidinium_carterae.1
MPPAFSVLVARTSRVVAHPSARKGLCVGEVLGCKLTNVYDINSRVYILKLARTNHKRFLLLESGVRFHLTNYERDKAVAQFAMLHSSVLGLPREQEKAVGRFCCIGYCPDFKSIKGSG